MRLNEMFKLVFEEPFQGGVDFRFTQALLIDCGYNFVHRAHFAVGGAIPQNHVRAIAQGANGGFGGVDDAGHILAVHGARQDNAFVGEFTAEHAANHDWGNTGGHSAGVEGRHEGAAHVDDGGSVFDGLFVGGEIEFVEEVGWGEEDGGGLLVAVGTTAGESERHGYDTVLLKDPLRDLKGLADEIRVTSEIVDGAHGGVEGGGHFQGRAEMEVEAHQIHVLGEEFSQRLGGVGIVCGGQGQGGR